MGAIEDGSAGLPLGELTPDVLALALEHQLKSLASDPLERFACVTPDGQEYVQQRRMIESVIAALEAFFCGGNQTGKTTIGAAILVALAQGRRTLCGIVLPLFPQPSVWWVLVQTREQQVESTQAAIFAMLGDWNGGIPRHQWVKNSRMFPEAAILILVKPIGGGDDPKRWTKIWFHVEGSGSNTLPGGRVDGVWADEPPSEPRWQEVRFRGRGNELFLTWITATPIKGKTFPRWLKRDFDTCDGVASGGRIRLTASVFDNPFLSDEHKAGLVQKVAGRPKEAMRRLHGAYVDQTGDCPFEIEGDPLDRWQERATRFGLPRRETVEIWSEVEGLHQQRERVPLVVSYEEFWPMEPGEIYYVPSDPSFGIRDEEHDPAGIHVYALRRPRLVARFHDYLAPYALGWLQAALCKRYTTSERPWMDVEINRGLGEPVFRGARDAGFDNFMVDIHDDRMKGFMENRFGWETTGGNRGSFIGGVQRVLMDDSVLVVSRGVVDTLRGVIINPKGKEEGHHDEDMILLGRFAYVYPHIKPEPVYVPESFRMLLQRELGRPVLVDQQNETEDWGPGL